MFFSTCQVGLRGIKRAPWAYIYPEKEIRAVEILQDKKGIKSAVLSAARNLGEQSCVEVISNRRAVVDGCKSVVEYDSDFIRLDLGEKKTVFRGRELVITQFEKNHAEICGIFSSVEFE